MRDLSLLLVHVVATVLRVVQPGGLRAVIAESEAFGRARCPLRAGLFRRVGRPEYGYLGRSQGYEGEPFAPCQRIGSAHRRLADRSEGARSAGFYFGGLSLRIRPNASLREWRWPRS